MEHKHPIIKKIGLSFIVGSGFIITFLVAQALLIGATGVELSTSIGMLGEAAGQILENPMLLGVAATSMIITGALVLLWVEIKGAIAPHLGLEKSGIKIRKEPKRIVGFIVVLLAIGVITSLIFGGFNDFIAGYSPTTDLRSLNSLYDAIINQNPIMVVWVFAAIVVFGALVMIAGALYNPVKTKLLPKKYEP